MIEKLSDPDTVINIERQNQDQDQDQVMSKMRKYTSEYKAESAPMNNGTREPSLSPTHLRSLSYDLYKLKKLSEPDNEFKSILRLIEAVKRI